MIYKITSQKKDLIEGCLEQGEVRVNGLRFKIEGNGVSAHTQNRRDFNAFIGTPGFSLYDGDGTFLQDSDHRVDIRGSGLEITQADLDANFTRQQQAVIAGIGGVEGAVKTVPPSEVDQDTVGVDRGEYEAFLAWQHERDQQRQVQPQGPEQGQAAQPQAPGEEGAGTGEEAQGQPDQGQEGQEPVTGLPGSEGDPSLSAATARDARKAELEAMNVPTLKALMTEKGIQFDGRDNKDSLIGKALAAEFPEK